MKARLAAEFKSGKVWAKDTGNLYHVDIQHNLTGTGMRWVFSWWWDEYDGAPDSGHQYTGEADTFEQLWAQIREAEAEREEEINA